MTGTSLVFAMILPRVEEIEDARVPGLNVDSEGAGALVSVLVDIVGGSVAGTGHGDDGIRVAH